MGTSTGEEVQFQDQGAAAANYQSLVQDSLKSANPRWRTTALSTPAATSSSSSSSRTTPFQAFAASVLLLEGFGFQQQHDDDPDDRKLDLTSVPTTTTTSSDSVLLLHREQDHSELHEMKLLRHSSAPNQTHQLQGTLDEPCFPTSATTATTAESPTLHMARHSKSNQELNEELQIKADELEKLFAAHKLRLHRDDQLTSPSRSKSTDLHLDLLVTTKSAEAPFSDRLHDRENPVMGSSVGCSSDPAGVDGHILMMMMMRVPDNDDNNDNQEVGTLEGSKGKLYDIYMQKRDAKLKEECSLKRAQKEAKLKAMEESLEQSRAEMKARFSGSSADRQDSALHARRRAERLRSFNVRSSTMNKLQPIESVMNNEDDLYMFPGRTFYKRDLSFSQTINSSTYRNSQPKKLLPDKNSSSSIPRTSEAPGTRSSVKISIPQPVPYLSSIRKEKMRPSSGITTNTASHQQVRSHSRCKGIKEDTSLLKEDKLQRSQTLTKTSPSLGEFKDFPPRKSDSVVLTPLIYVREQKEQRRLFNKVPKNCELNPFLSKGNGIAPGSGTGIAKLKGAVASESLNDEEEYNELTEQLEDSMDVESKAFLRKGDGIDIGRENTETTELIKPSKTFENVKNEEKANVFISQLDDSNPLIRNDGDIFHGAGTGMSKLMASMVSENLKNEEELEELDRKLEGPIPAVKEKEVREFELVIGEEASMASNISAAYSDNENSRLCQESETSSISRSESSSVLKLSLKVQPDLFINASSSPFTTHGASELGQNSLGETHASWSLPVYRPCANETSYIDTSVDFPIGSPASSRSASVTKEDVDVVWMGKHWSSIQDQDGLANDTHHLPHKDVTKGFKRFLKFGRKSRGKEILVDRISATTSEGDDDNEEARDLSRRSSDDLTKSRMGFSRSSYDSPGDGEMFSRQVQALRSCIPVSPEKFKLPQDHLSSRAMKAPRSFLSFSSFRSKGSESKPR